MRGDEQEIGVRERVHVDFGESIEERARQAFAAASLGERILAGEYFRARFVHGERAAELGDEYFGTVVETSVEAFEHRLRRQIDLVQYDPMTLADL